MSDFRTKTVTMNAECGCCRSNCICGRPLGATLKLLFASANDPATVHEVILTYGDISEDGIICSPFSPDPFPGYSGHFEGTLALPMGGRRDDTLDIRMQCVCLDCPLCIWYRYGSNPPGIWCVANIVEVIDCECPALFTVNDFELCDVWSYQIYDITISELDSDCV